jgi:exonuclease SbcD
MADPHLGLGRYSTPGTTSRTDDFAATLMRFAKVAVEADVDAAFMAGDTFHTRRPTPTELHALTSALRVLQDASIPVYIIPGNHDGSDTVGDPRTQALAWMSALNLQGIHLITTPVSMLMQGRGGVPFTLISVPYPHKSMFDAVMPDATPDQRVEKMSVVLEQSIETMIDVAREKTPDVPIVFLGHLSTVGAQLGTETSMRFGWDVTIRSGLLDKVDYGALGHIHRQQQVGEKSWYAGSPEYMDFGEAGQDKGFLLVDIQVGKNPKVERINSMPRPMYVVNIRQIESPIESQWVQDETQRDFDGAIVLVHIHPLPGEPFRSLDRTRITKQYRDRGASHVTTDVVVTETERVLRASMDSEVKATDALRSWLEVNGHDLEPAYSTGVSIIQSIGAGE